MLFLTTLLPVGVSRSLEIIRVASYMRLCLHGKTAGALGLVASGEIWVPVATKYYTQTLNLLIQQLHSPAPKDDTLSASIILSSYEVLATQAQEYRQHCEEATRLVQMYGISAQSVGIDRAKFLDLDSP